jgi:hypothetical protein
VFLDPPFGDTGNTDLVSQALRASAQAISPQGVVYLESARAWTADELSTLGLALHKQGKAVDFDVKGMTADEVRGVLRLNQIELMKLGLTRIETGISWVHIDLKYTGLNYLYEFKP